MMIPSHGLSKIIRQSGRSVRLDELDAVHNKRPFIVAAPMRHDIHAVDAWIWEPYGPALPLGSEPAECRKV